MQGIGDWLEKLGVSEYAGRFVENGIDFSVLPDLTDQDLKDIGVLLGHRRKMLPPSPRWQALPLRHLLPPQQPSQLKTLPNAAKSR